MTESSQHNTGERERFDDVREAIGVVARTVEGAAALFLDHERHREFAAFLRPAASRGYVHPSEEELIVGWWGQYLTARSALLEAVWAMREIVDDGRAIEDEKLRLQAFVAGFTGACLLVRAGRTLVYDIAVDELIRRKFNEAIPSHRIPRKVFTEIFRSLTSPGNLYRLSLARRYHREQSSAIAELASDPLVGPLLPILESARAALDVGHRRALWSRVEYRLHSWRRRRRSVWRQTMFAMAEGVGCVIADIRNPFHESRLPAQIEAEIASMIEPGDVLVTRHNECLSNVFLPGYWPHSALHLGSESQRKGLGIVIPGDRGTRLVDPFRSLEARKDGVLFRPLDDTLSVDAVAVLRPRLDHTQIVQSIERVVEHEGKLYNFDFDFFTADRLVCTEVVYRAYEGIGGVQFALTERAGRPTLSAEDLVAMATNGEGFDAVAVFGTPGSGHSIHMESAARDILRKLRQSEGD